MTSPNGFQTSLSVYLKAHDFCLDSPVALRSFPLVFMTMSINARYLLLLALLHLSLIAAAPVDPVPRSPDTDTVIEGNTPLGIGESYHRHQTRHDGPISRSSTAS